jgi:hypothetical protein
MHGDAQVLSPGTPQMAECHQKVYAENFHFMAQQYAHQSPAETFGEPLHAAVQAVTQTARSRTDDALPVDFFQKAESD